MSFSLSQQSLPQQQLYKDEEELKKAGRKYSESARQMDPLKELDREIKESFFARHSVPSINDFFKLADVSSFIDEKTELKEFDIAFDDHINEALIENTHDYGYASSICESQQYLLVGTAFSLIYVFDKQKKSTSFLVAGQDKIKESGKVTALAINHDELIFAAGFENGDIAIYELKATKELPRMTTMKRIFKAPLIFLQFVSEIYPSLKEFCIVAYDSQYNNLKIQVEVTTVFEKHFTSINKEKLTYYFLEEQQQQQQQPESLGTRTNSDSEIKNRQFDGLRESSKSIQIISNHKNNLADLPPQSLDEIHGISYLNGISSMKYFKKSYKILAIADVNSVSIGFLLYKSIQFTFRLNFQTSYQLFKHSKSIPVKLDSNQLTNLSTKQSIPSVSWGEGYFKGNNTGYPLLAIGYEKSIFLIRISILEDEHLQFYQAAYASLQKNILSCAFISHSIIFVIFQDYTSALIHTSNFTLGPQNTSSDNSSTSALHLDHIQEFTKLSMASLQSKYPLFFTFSESSVRYLLPQSYVSTFRLKNWQEYLNNLVNGQEKLMLISIMQQTLMVLTNRIKYLGGIKDDKSARMEDMKPFIQQLSRKFLEDSLGRVKQQQQQQLQIGITINQDEEVTKILMITIEFLLSTENSEYLFNTILQIIQPLGFQPQLIQCLQPFIESSRISVLPTQSMTLVMDYYSGKQRYDILQQLILSFDVTALDIPKLLEICIKYELFNALIHICQQQKDYITPLLRLLGNYEIKFNQNGQGIVGQNQTQNARQFGLKILWYIQQTILGRKIDGFDIEQNIMENELPFIVKLMFQEQNLLSILQIDRRIALDTIFLLFKPKASEILKAKSTDVKIDKQEELVKQFGVFQKNEVVNNSDNINGKEDNKQQQQQQYNQDATETKRIKNIKEQQLQSKNTNIQIISLFEVIIAAVLSSLQSQSQSISSNNKLSSQDKQQKLDELKYLQTVFLSRIIEQQTYPISIEKQIQIVDFLVENPQTFVYFEKPQSENQYFNTSDSKQQVESAEKYNRKIMTRNAFLINILRPLLPLVSDPLKLAHFASQAEINEFTEACCFVYNYQKNYRKCFSLYLESRNQLIRGKIFNWIEQVIDNTLIAIDTPQLPIDSPQVDRSSISATTSNLLQSVEDLKSLIISQIKSLVKLNPHSSKNLIVKYFSGQQKDILLKLDSFPTDQLNILEELLLEPDRVSDELKLMHLKLLCKIHPEQVLENLKERELPSDAAIAICKENNILDGLVFLLLRDNKYKQALDIQTQMLAKQWKQSQKELLQQQEEKIGVLQLDEKQESSRDKQIEQEQQLSPKQLEEQILLSLHTAMEICLQSEKGDKQNNELWITLFETIIVNTIGTQTLTSIEQPTEIVTLATKIVSQLILEMAKNTQLESVFDQLHTNYQTIPLKAFLETNDYFREQYEFQASSNLISNASLQKSILDLQRKVHAIKNGGLSGSQMPDYRVCQLCEVPFEDPTKQKNQTANNLSATTSADLASKELLIFYCGHTYHNSCVKDFITPMLCPICIENPLNTLNINTVNGNKTFSKTGKRIARKQSYSQDDDPFDSLNKQKRGSLNTSNVIQNGWMTSSQIEIVQSTEKKNINNTNKSNKEQYFQKLSKFDVMNSQKRSEFENFNLLA